MAAFTDEQEARITLIENTINEMSVYLKNMVSTLVWRQTILHLEQTITSLTTRVATLESQMTTIINRLDNLG